MNRRYACRWLGPAAAMLTVGGLCVWAAHASEDEPRRLRPHTEADRTDAQRTAAARRSRSYLAGRPQPLHPGDVDLNAEGGVELFFELTRRNAR